MQVSEETIRAFITASGIVMIGQEDIIEEGIIEETASSKEGLIGVSVGTFNKVKLLFPFRFMAQQGDDGLRLSVMAPIIKEEWIIIDLCGTVECQVNDIVKETYIKYVKQVFSGIILPEEKKLIL